MSRTNQVISLTSATLVLFIATSAFVLSFEALRTLAHDVGVDNRMAWLYPAIIDGAIIVFSLSVLRASLSGEKTLYPWILVSVFTILSIALNITHAQSGALAQFMAAIPPVALFLSFELLMSQVKSMTRRSQTHQSLNDIIATLKAERIQLEKSLATKTKQLDTLVQEKTASLEKLSAEIEQLENKKQRLVSELNQHAQTLSTSSKASIAHAREVRALKKEQAINELLAYLRDHPKATLSEMATVIKRSKSTAGIYVSELQTSARLTKNSQGWVVQIDK